MSFFFVAMILAMIAVAGVLFTGIFAMVRGGEFNRKYGNKLMRARIILQGVAIVMFMLLLWTTPKS